MINKMCGFFNKDYDDEKDNAILNIFFTSRNKVSINRKYILLTVVYSNINYL